MMKMKGKKRTRVLMMTVGSHMVVLDRHNIPELEQEEEGEENVDNLEEETKEKNKDDWTPTNSFACCCDLEAKVWNEKEENDTNLEEETLEEEMKEKNEVDWTPTNNSFASCCDLEAKVEQEHEAASNPQDQVNNAGEPRRSLVVNVESMDDNVLGNELLSKLVKAGIEKSDGVDKIPTVQAQATNGKSVSFSTAVTVRTHAIVIGLHPWFELEGLALQAVHRVH